MKDDIILRAYQYAIETDLDNLSLVKISLDLNISRRSLYRIFSDKYELMFEVYKVIIDELLEEAHAMNKKCENATGYEQTICAMENMITVFLKHPKKIKFVTKFDALIIDNVKLLTDKNDFYRKCDFTYYSLKKGVQDGSIRPDINEYKTSCVILETVLGIVSRFHNLDKEEYVDYMSKKDIYELVKAYACYINVK